MTKMLLIIECTKYVTRRHDE